MVEGGAKQVPEPEILAGAPARAPARSPPLIDMQEELAPRVGKPKLAVAAAGRPRATLAARVRAQARGAARERARRSARSTSATRRSPRSRRRWSTASSPRSAKEPVALDTLAAIEKRQAELRELSATVKDDPARPALRADARAHPRRRRAHRRPASRRDPPDRLRGAAAAARRTASRCSRAARRRRWSTPRSAGRATQQTIDALTARTSKRFYLHYNFPPFSVGEARMLRGPGAARGRPRQPRRARARSRCCPTSRSFPYTIRVVSEMLESNGSSSMATICGGTLSLMDAGVPIEAPVAGIAMGLIEEGDRVRDPLRHPRRRGPPRRHGLQGRRARARASPRCRWTSRSAASTGR